MSISRRFIKPFCAAALAAFLLAPSAANAVTTPQQYCASLGSPSCEVLNALPGGLLNTTQYYLIHYCRNGLLHLAQVPLNYNTAAIGLIGTNTSVCGYLP